MGVTVAVATMVLVTVDVAVVVSGIVGVKVARGVGGGVAVLVIVAVLVTVLVGVAGGVGVRVGTGVQVGSGGGRGNVGAIKRLTAPHSSVMAISEPRTVTRGNMAFISGVSISTLYHTSTCKKDLGLGLGGNVYGVPAELFAEYCVGEGQAVKPGYCLFSYGDLAQLVAAVN